MAYRMFKGAHVVVDPTRQLPSTPMQFMAGGGIGIASAILELGRKFNRSIFKPSWRGHAKAVATSAACGLPVQLLERLALCGLVQKNKSQCLTQLVMCISMLLLALVS